MIKTTSKILFRTILSVVVLAVVIIAVVIGAVSRGPVSLAFMTPYLSEVLVEQYPKLDLQFDDLQMLWDGRDKNMVFAVTNLSVGREGEKVAFVPQVTVTFSRKALINKKIAPSGLEFEGLNVRLRRDHEGSVKLGYSYGEVERTEQVDASQNEKSSADTETLHRLLAGLGQQSESDDLTAYLQRLEIYRSEIQIDDDKLGKSWKISSADVVIWSSDEGVNGHINGKIGLGGEQIELVANTVYDRKERTTTLASNIQDFPVSLLAAEIPDLEILSGVSLVTSGDIHLSIDENFTPIQVGFNLGVGEGIIDIPDLYKKPLQIRSATFEGHSMFPFNGVNINKANIVTVGPTVDLAGSFSQSEDGLALSLEGGIKGLKTDDLGLYWPYSAAVDGYNWVTARIRDGITKDVKFLVDLQPEMLKSGKIPDEAIKLEFAFDGLSTNYFPPLPKVTDISGEAVLTATKIHLYDLTGKLQDMTVSSGDVLIYDFDKPDQMADITVTVEGQNKSIFGFLDKKPLELVRDFGIQPEQMTGVGKVTAQFVFPLKDDLLLQQVQYEAKGQFADALIPDVYDEYDVTNGNFAALVTPEKLTVKGQGKLADIPSDISFQAWLNGKQKGQRRYEVQASLSDKDRLALGQPNADFLKGNVDTSLVLNVIGDGTANGLVTMNLLEASIEVPDLRISKPIGVAGHIGTQFSVSTGGNTEFTNIRMVSETLEFNGNATLDAQGLVQLTAKRLQFSGNDLGLQVIRNNQDSYTANLRGEYFDLRPYIVENYSLNEGKAEARKEDKTPDVLLNLTMKKVQMDGDVFIENVNGYVDYANNVIRQSNVEGLLNGKNKLVFDMTQSLKGRHMEFKTDHAGLLLQGLDIYDNAREGEVVIKADIDDTQEESVAKGWVDMKEIRIVNAPVLSRILTVGSLGGIVELLEGDGMTFATVEGPFTYTNGVIETKNFRAVGSIGITFSGKVDQKSGSLDAFGTVIPSYTLNSMLGNIPLLGRLLVGREGEGIFGFSYRVEGTSEDPKIFVNPVSALAPGILRRMFFEPWTGAGDADPSIPDYPGKGDESPRQ
ncbi:hypothetical protein GUA87_09235 [Sneathiella sp. P13V-1]|uniref:YhdP family protein n=1 Tax=Sneathiella sp. P13V-1 TaxID=2697366 RepID=UPI00187BA14C|nr:AsmA-like C-terminal region-containing protein [Sneathiella sp. P13V-1]MBE7637025.1 hypothetical protein [Sneathiella sp. P13V-1]